jgi:hypothetical protein
VVGSAHGQVEEEKRSLAAQMSNVAGRGGGPAPATPQAQRRRSVVSAVLSPRQGQLKGVGSRCVRQLLGRSLGPAHDEQCEF